MKISPSRLKIEVSRLKSTYWPLIKSLQTTLLLTTGLAGFFSARCPVIHWSTLVGLTGSLFLSIGGSTILNMWYDRDIDEMMKRTCNRPLCSGRISPQETLRLGALLSILGVGWALALDGLYGAVVFAGLFFDVLIYTVWLKRRTAWSIVWGGVAGGMPALAGRALGSAGIDWIGVTLSLAVLFWIPTHILTFSMRYFEDYQRAGVPTFPARYGFAATRAVIAVSSVLAGLAMGGAALGTGLTQGLLHLLGLLSGGLLALAVASLLRPSERVNFALFKYASLYMLAAMLLISLAAL
ncbi:MAG: heme o synthase [Chloroflexota bacterium]